MTPEETIEKLEQCEYSSSVLAKALSLTGDFQNQLFHIAQLSREKLFPNREVQVRSVIELSNICRQKCKYCIIGADNQKINYTLGANETIALMDFLYNEGRRTILLQSGENNNASFIDDVVKSVSAIKDKYQDLQIILCMGDLSQYDYQRLYDAGASNYILKFETSNPKLFSYCKPNDTLGNRLRCIETLIDIGYNVGSGNIVGLPGQTIQDIISDLLLVHRLPLAMNSTTVFIPAENSIFENEPAGNPNITLNMMALMRIMNPHRYMPTTSSLEKMIPDGQYLGLLAGANTVTIHDGTPEHLQKYFPIYSTKRVLPQKEHFRDIISKAGLKNIQ